MRIIYEFVDGTNVEIEVDEKFGKEIKELDRKEYNNNRAETRRHQTIDNFNDKYIELMDEEPKTFIQVNNEFYEVGDERIVNALSKLTKKQKEVMEFIYIRNFSIKEYAELKGLKKNTVSELHQRALDRMKKYF